MRYMRISEDLEPIILAAGTDTPEAHGPTVAAGDDEHGTGTEDEGIEATEVENANDVDP